MAGNPQTIADWLAYVSLIVTAVVGAASLAALAWAAVRHTATEAGRAQRARDERVQELARIIYNLDTQFGLGAQILAVDELRRFRDRKPAVIRFASALKRDWTAKGAANELIEALDHLEKDLKR